MKRGGLIAIVVALAVLVLAALAGATRTVHIKSKVSIANHHGLHFAGRVTSPNAACEQGRKVVLYRVIESGPDQVCRGDRSRTIKLGG